ncbi:unknown [Crocosphaera subtropica ATCC 51142]|uniref:FHA domain-containing protein n=1 Tax=Crocosphaera subtropica (strain ATCC 51142 / BH68) TaxID=43989 RepID=B1WT21_CROS5|nr:unknown [Crocosphaera subtropica ATCC 51142]
MKCPLLTKISVITLTLLHPTKTTPIQSWTFETTATIRIGRSMDNEVVLYSAVVSRHHLEIRYEENHWQVVNLGTNGTYIDGELISQKQAKDGMIIRLASSGPTIQIHLSPEESSVKRQTAQIHQSNSSSSVQ